MRVYHASDTCIHHPDISHSRNALDFGKGFYVTKLKEQAIKYAERFLALGNKAFIHEYEYTPCDKFKNRAFDAYNEEWLNFVSRCRQGG